MRDVSEETAILASAVALSIAGVAFAVLAATTAHRIAVLVGFAGGIVILLVAVFHLAPEAFNSGGLTERLFLFAGAALGVVLEFLFRNRAEESPATIRLGAWLGVLVLAIHSTLDGAVYTAVFWRGDNTELVASLGLILHEAPEGVVAMMLALQAGLRAPMAAFVAVLASSITTPVGWMLAHAIGESGNGVMRSMFAASAGLMVYVGWHLIAGGWKALRAGRNGAA
jgi:zinc and cadmium transporter